MGILSRMLKDIRKEELNITSLQLVEEMNFFREKEGNKKKIRHDTLLNIIRNEFEEEISLQELLESKYTSERGKKYPMFILTHDQGKQILMRESRYVRKAIIKYINILEGQYKIALKSIEHTKQTHDKIKDLIIDLNFEGKKYMMINNEINDIVSDKFSKNKLKKENMDSEELDFRAEVEEFYVGTIRKNRKHGGTKRLATNKFL